MPPARFGAPSGACSGTAVRPSRAADENGWQIELDIHCSAAAGSSAEGWTSRGRFKLSWAP